MDERYKRIIEFINPHKEESFLIIGTGVHPTIEEIIFKYGCEKIVSGDIDQKNLDNGKKILPKVKFLKFNAEKRFPFPDNSFDKIILTEVLEHLKKEKKVLREIRRVLKDNGRLILSVPKRRWFKIFNPITHIQHYREYNEEMIKERLERTGYDIERIFIGGNIFELFNLWMHLILKYFFGVLHLNNFFNKQIDRAYRRNYRGKGTDIILVAKKTKSSLL